MNLPPWIAVYLLDHVSRSNYACIVWGIFSFSVGRMEKKLVTSSRTYFGHQPLFMNRNWKKEERETELLGEKSTHSLCFILFCLFPGWLMFFFYLVDLFSQIYDNENRWQQSRFNFILKFKDGKQKKLIWRYIHLHSLLLSRWPINNIWFLWERLIPSLVCSRQSLQQIIWT